MPGQVGSLIVSVVLVVAALWATTTGIAHAYIDAGTGSLILQFLVAGFFGSLFALKVFWRQITDRMSTLLTKIRARNSSEL